MGFAPGMAYGPRPSGWARTRGVAPSLISHLRRGGASPHIRRQSRGGRGYQVA